MNAVWRDSRPALAEKISREPVEMLLLIADERSRVSALLGWDAFLLGPGLRIVIDENDARALVRLGTGSNAVGLRSQYRPINSQG